MIGKRLDVADLWLHPKYLIQRDRKRGGRGGKVRRGKKRGRNDLNRKKKGVNRREREK